MIDSKFSYDLLLSYLVFCFFNFNEIGSLFMTIRIINVEFLLIGLLIFFN